MASRIAEAYVQIVPRIDGIGSKLSSGLSSEMGKIGEQSGKTFGGKFATTVKSLVGPALAAFSAVGIANFFKDSIQAASNFEAEFEGVNQVFGKFAGIVQDFADGAGKTAGLSATEALQAAKTFGLFFTGAGRSEEEAANFSNTLVQLAGDLGSFNDVPTPEALAAIQSGLMGQSEPLRKFGVFLDDARLRQEALNMGIYDGKGPLDQQQKMLAAYNSILAQTQVQQGDYVKYADTFGNAIKTATKEFDNLTKDIGLALLPIMTQLANFLANDIIPALRGLFDWVNQNGAVIGTFIGVLGGLALAFNAVRIATTLWTAAQTLLNFVLSANPLGIIAIGIAALAAGIVYLATQTTFFQDTWKAMTTFIKTTWDNVTSFFKVQFPGIVNLFSALITGIKNLWNGFITFFGIAVKGIVDFFTPVFEAVGSIIKLAINAWISYVQGFFDFFVGIVNSVLSLVQTVLNAISKVTGGAGTITVPKIKSPKIPKLAEGGFVEKATTAIIGEAGPEVVTPLKDFERMMGLDKKGASRVINYYAAENKSVDSEQALLQAIKRAKVITGW
jgi:hypothetical protein